MVTPRQPTLGPLVYRGKKQIGMAVGISYAHVDWYVENRGLPAFKHNDGHWVALPDDLLQWVREQRDKHLKRNPVNSKEKQTGRKRAK